MFNDEESVVIEGIYSGTHTGPLVTADGSIPATDRPFTFTIVEVLECFNAQIKTQHLYWDNNLFLIQLGLISE